MSLGLLVMYAWRIVLHPRCRTTSASHGCTCPRPPGWPPYTTASSGAGRTTASASACWPGCTTLGISTRTERSSSQVGALMYPRPTAYLLHQDTSTMPQAWRNTVHGFIVPGRRCGSPTCPNDDDLPILLPLARCALPSPCPRHRPFPWRRARHAVCVGHMPHSRQQPAPQPHHMLHLRFAARRQPRVRSAVRQGTAGLAGLYARFQTGRLLCPYCRPVADL